MRALEAHGGQDAMGEEGGWLGAVELAGNGDFERREGDGDGVGCGGLVLGIPPNVPWKARRRQFVLLTRAHGRFCLGLRLVVLRARP